ncbi:MAG: helix-turn-helix domain-containing protein [Pseudomonadota bacterium]
MIKYTRMNLKERETIYNLLKLGYNQTSIAKILDRHRSSISKELRRCASDPLGYLPDRAERNAQSFLRRNEQTFRSQKLCTYVTTMLKEGWSPEQISGRLKLEQAEVQVSHETIYKFIYSEEGNQQKLV